MDAIKCQWCGSYHQARCPQIKAVDFHPDGTVKRYEFFGPKDYPQQITLMPTQDNQLSSYEQAFIRDTVSTGWF